MKVLSEEMWRRLPFLDFRARFFVEVFIEKLSMYTPHFYQSRLMNIIGSCREALNYIDEFNANEKNRSYILNSLDEIESCWQSDPISKEVFKFAAESKDNLFKTIRGGDFGVMQINRLSLVCRSVISRENEYVLLLVQSLRSAICSPQDLTRKDRITEEIHALTGLYTTHLLNKGYSPTYLYHRAEMFTRASNYAGKTFEQQLQSITDRLQNNAVLFHVYYAIHTNRRDMFLRIDDDPGLAFQEALPERLPAELKNKLEVRFEGNLYAKAGITSTDYISAAWKVKEKIDKTLDVVTALEPNLRIKISSVCLSSYKNQGLWHGKAVNIDVLMNFLASESGSSFAEFDKSIRQTLVKLDEPGQDHLGRSLRYLRIARDSVSFEQKLLNLWIALESILSDADGNILANIVAYVPQIYAVNAILRRVEYLRRLLIKHKVALPENARQLAGVIDGVANEGLTVETVYKLMRDEKLAVELFDSINEKEHLKFRLFSTFRELKDNKSILDRIERSKRDVERQIKRIYFVRNKIAHTGHYENVKPQLVIHLLDYIAVCYMAIISSAQSVNGEDRHSIADFLSAYKMGVELVVKSASSPDELDKLDDLLPVPVI